MENAATLDLLFREGITRLERSGLFGTPLAPKPVAFDSGKVEGMLLGIAISDSPGITTEELSPSVRRRRQGEIRDYTPNRYGDERRGFPSDDTQISFRALEQMIRDRGFVPAHVAQCFAGRRIFGIGSFEK